MAKIDEFILANEALKRILGGANINGMMKTFSFSGANAVMEADNLSQKELNCGCGCSCNDGAGNGGGAGS